MKKQGYSLLGTLENGVNWKYLRKHTGTWGVHCECHWGLLGDLAMFGYRPAMKVEIY